MNLIELVPHNLDTLLNEAETLIANCSELSGINIPDVLRLPIRSFEAARFLLKRGFFVVPHLRSIDRTATETCDIVASLIQDGLQAVLVVTGDKPTHPEAKVYDTSSLALISELKNRFPTLQVYGALDPYRQSLTQECRYGDAKIQAGASGLFTQPFFHSGLAQFYLDYFSTTQLFLGMSPVLTESSLNYWKTKNLAVFPPNFQLDLASNCRLGASLVKQAQVSHQHTYLMPIKVPPLDYARGVFLHP